MMWVCVCVFVHVCGALATMPWTREHTRSANFEESCAVAATATAIGFSYIYRAWIYCMARVNILWTIQFDSLKLFGICEIVEQMQINMYIPFKDSWKHTILVVKVCDFSSIWYSVAIFIKQKTLKKRNDLTRLETHHLTEWPIFCSIEMMSSFCNFWWIECFGNNPIVLIAIISAGLLSERIFFSVFDLDLKD